MEYHVLASGSKGNSIFIYDQGNGLLIDCGISKRQLYTKLNQLRFHESDIHHVLLTHDHIDHNKNISIFDQSIVYCGKGCIPGIDESHELENYQNGEHSLYGVIENAGKDKDSADKALNEMLSFTEFANKQINMKRNELLIPIQNQKRELLMSVDSSFRNVIYANATLTAHLESVHKVKEKQNKLLTNIGLGGLDDKVTSRLVELSEAVDKIVREGNTINTKSSEAKQNVENILNDIKELTNKVTE